MSDCCGWHQWWHQHTENSALFLRVYGRPKFAWKMPIKLCICVCHRMVNNALAEEMKSIHALTQKTLTPEQWQQQQQATT